MEAAQAMLQITQEEEAYMDTLEEELEEITYLKSLLSNAGIVLFFVNGILKTFCLGEIIAKMPKAAKVDLVFFQIGTFQCSLETCSKISLHVSYLLHTLEYYWTDISTSKKYKIRFKLENIHAWQILSVVDNNNLQNLQLDLCWPPLNPYIFEKKPKATRGSYVVSPVDFTGQVTTVPRHTIRGKSGVFTTIFKQLQDSFNFFANLDKQVATISPTTYSSEITATYVEYLKKCSVGNWLITSEDIDTCKKARNEIKAHIAANTVVRTCAFCAEVVFIDTSGKYVKFG